MKRIDDIRGLETRRSILVVEDSRLNRETLRMILESDFDVLMAEDGHVGLLQLAEHYEELSLVLLDVYMPACDGFEFLKRMKQDGRYDSIPVIVTTASASVEDERRCLELGATDFIVKPYDREVIANRINNLIRLRESASIVNLLIHDRVTGLCSKEYFYRMVEETLFASPEAEYDIVCSDIDNFKELNDRYGEANCDRLLHDLAKRLVNVLPGLMVSGRIGADTFAFLMEHQEPGWESILDSVVDGFPVANLGLKFGIVECIDPSESVPISCSKGLTAIDTVKERLGVCVARFNAEMRERLLTEQIIRESMGEALEDRQFFVQFQPKHDVREGKTAGAEALVRWNHPELGLVNPGVFITLFERNGFIAQLDMFVWEEACKEIRRCEDKGLPVVPISVNVSRLDFDSSDLPQRIAGIADKYGVDHSLLHVELTETAYSGNPEAVRIMLGELRDLGFSVELDDFGAGYSSLASLNTLPLDVMKLDMSLVRKATELDDFRIIESIINLAQRLDMRSVVEGVETANEADRVADIGCDFIQGYYYSKPLSRDEFEAYLERECE